MAGSYFGGQILLGIVVAGAFAAILSTVGRIDHRLRRKPSAMIWWSMSSTRTCLKSPASRWPAWPRSSSGLLGIPLGLWAENMQIAILVGLAFAIAASTFFPVLVMGVWWPRMTKKRRLRRAGGRHHRLVSP